MDIEYDYLDQAETDAALVGHMRASQADHHSHTVNKERYTLILAEKGLDDKFRAKITEDLRTTLLALKEVELIIKHLRGQLPKDPERIDAALQKMDIGHLKIPISAEARIARLNAEVQK